MNGVAVGVPRDELVLASASPRRSEILTQLGIRFRVQVSHVDEPPFEHGDPGHYALELASRKAEFVLGLQGESGAMVLGADTIVVKGDAVLGKPEDDVDAERMLSLLQGGVHDVKTAVALRGAGDLRRDLVVRTRVWFRPMNSAAIQRYVASGEGRDKAGSYAIQGLGAGLVERIDGSYSNVVGLPAAQTLTLLEAAGVVGSWP